MRTQLRIFRNIGQCVTTFCLVAVFSSSFDAQAQIFGTVFHDENANGLQDKGEKGLSDVPVSNGDTIVLTDKKGQFLLPSSSQPLTPVFPILPANFSMSAQNLPMVKNGEQLAFGAVRRKDSKHFRSSFVGDIHVEDSTMFYYFRRTIVDRLLEEKNIDQNVWLGDLVNESPKWHKPMAEVIRLLPSPSYFIMGNHDFDDRRGKSQEYYTESYGADTYAFRRGSVCFVMLNNSRGAYKDSDLRFVKNLAQLLPKDCLIVLSQHIPLDYDDRGDEMKSILDACNRKVLIMSAHEHIVMRKVYGPMLTDQTVGSVCSIWWRGTKNEDWTPHSLQQCGSPRNFFVVEFNGPDYKLEYHPIVGEKQMRIWFEGDDPEDKSIDALAKFEKGSVVVNVFGADDSTIVSLQIDGGESIEMTHTPAVDPYVSRLASLSTTYPRKDPRRAPYLKAPSPHLWTSVLPENLTGVHTLTIRAEGSDGFLTEEKVMFTR